MTQMKEQTLDTGDIVLNYAENDHQGSALMIIHGIMLCWQDMRGFIEPLSQTHHVFAPICVVTVTRATPASVIPSLPMLPMSFTS